MLPEAATEPTEEEEEGEGGGVDGKERKKKTGGKEGKKGEQDYEMPQEIRREEQMRTGNRLYGSRTRSKTGFHLRHPAFTVWASRHIYNIGHIQRRYTYNIGMR